MHQEVLYLDHLRDIQDIQVLPMTNNQKILNIEDRNYTLLGKRWDSECNMTCGGNPDEICGGFWRMSIYDCEISIIINLINV